MVVYTKEIYSIEMDEHEILKSFQSRYVLNLLILSDVVLDRLDEKKLILNTLSKRASLIGIGYSKIYIKYIEDNMKIFVKNETKEYFIHKYDEANIISLMEVESILMKKNKKEFETARSKYLCQLLSFVSKLSLKETLASQVFIYFMISILSLVCITEPQEKSSHKPKIYLFKEGWCKILMSDFTTLIANYFDSFDQYITEEHYEMYDLTKDSVRSWKSEIRKGLNSSSALNSMSSQLIKYLGVESFEERSLKYSKAIRFIDGIYDLSDASFTKIFPHHIQKNKIHSPFYKLGSNPELEAKLDQLMISFFPREEIRRYIYHVFSRCLRGKNDDKKIWFLIGRSNGGKSRFMDLVKNAFGDYACTLPPSFFASKKTGPSDPTPALTATIGKLIGIIQEPPPSGFNIELIKFLTGEEHIAIRKMYCEYSENSNRINSRFFVSANKVDMNSYDEAFWRRVVRIDFESEFLPDHEREARIAYITKCFNLPEYANRKKFDSLEKELTLYPKRDPNIEETISQVSKIFMARLIQYYYSPADLDKDFPYINESSTKFRYYNDPVTRFMEENIEKVTTHHQICLDTLYVSFKEWYEKKMPKRYLINLEQFYEALCQMNYHISNNNESRNVHNIKFKVFSDDTVDELDFSF